MQQNLWLGRERGGGGKCKGEEKVDVKIFPVVYIICLMSEVGERAEKKLSFFFRNTGREQTSGERISQGVSSKAAPLLCPGL